MLDSRLGHYTLGVLAHLGLLFAWYLFVRLGDVPKFVMPSPADTFGALLQPNYDWWKNTLVTGTEIFAGYGLALVVGVMLALAFTWSKLLEALALPLLVTLNMIPKVALGPLIDDDAVDSVVDTIVASAATGKIGDGKIWVTDVDRLVRIRTGEEGPDAV